MTKSREWLTINAVAAWLHNYAEVEAGELTKHYQEFYKELEDEQSNDTKTHKRGRPAKRQRKKETPSNPSSTEETKQLIRRLK